MKEKYKSNLLNRLRSENRSPRTLVIKDGKYQYQSTANGESDGGLKQFRANRLELISKRNNMLYCLNVLSPRKQNVNLLSLRQSKYQPKRKCCLRRSQSEYVKKRSKQIEQTRRLSIEAELNRIDSTSVSASETMHRMPFSVVDERLETTNTVERLENATLDKLDENRSNQIKEAKQQELSTCALFKDAISKEISSDSNNNSNCIKMENTLASDT